MAIKKRNFYAFQIDLHYQRSNNGVLVDSIKWDGGIAEELFKHVITLSKATRTKKYRDSWLVYLDYVDSDEHFIFGRFSSAEYGTRGELVHADNLSLRPNPKEIREGETESTYFIIKKMDGLMLLQGNLRLTRVILDEYIEQFGGEVISRNNLSFIQINTLVDESFFDSIEALNVVKNLEVEVSTTEEYADESPAVSALRGESEQINATSYKLKFEAKYQRSGITGIIGLAKKYHKQRGVTKIVVRGKLAGADKTLKLDDSQEKYSPRVEMDANNQPMLDSVEQVLRGIAISRKKLRS